ncbi:MAG: glycine zipper 2TM domain-containing protein [Nitrospiraceae bacterium]|nr:MAG: glycine zipper 2TM domain-containing protein [Nitrospiraceae bacterium]
MQKVIASVILLLFVVQVTGCSTMQETVKGHEGAATGAGVGAVTGAVLGSVIAGSGSRTEGAIIGGLAGALIGGAVGHYAFDQKKTREETAQKYNYQSSSGTMVRLEDASPEPAKVKQGDKVELKATYAVMTPSPETEVSITEMREIKLGDEIVGKPEVSVIRKGGTYTSAVPMFLPADAKKGTYTVLTTIQTATAKDTRETKFVVQ